MQASFNSIVQRYGINTSDEEIATTHRSMVMLLKLDGRVYEYDMEGDFWEHGAHAALVKKLCAFGGVEIECDDEWLPGKGWVLWLSLDSGEYFFFAPQESEHPNDWVEMEMVHEAVQTILAKHELLIVNLYTEDQICKVAVLPKDLIESLREANLIAEFDPSQWHELVEGKLNVSFQDVVSTSINGEKASSLRMSEA